LLCFLPAFCAAGLENLVADEELRGRESRAKPELRPSRAEDQITQPP
jgi:hypothetical protein